MVQADDRAIAFKNQVAVVGIGTTNHYGTYADMGAYGMAQEAFRNALDDCGLTQDDIDGLIVGSGTGEPTASQTAWAVQGLIAAGLHDHEATARGVRYLIESQQANGSWAETNFTGTGFPKVFYLRYHGYAKFFPVWAMARYRNLKAGNSRRVAYGL